MDSINKIGKLNHSERSLGKSVVFSLIFGGTVFFSGFFVLFIMYQNWLLVDNNAASNLKGLFDYKASSIGDSICLPILAGALFCYVFYNKTKTSKKVYIIPGIISAALIVAGIFIQFSWTVNENTENNWTIIDGKFNYAGWYHAIFFVSILGLLGWFFVRFFQVKHRELYDENDKKRDNTNTLLQYLIWASGSFFIFLNFTDDHSKKSYLNIWGIDIFWFLLMTMAVLFIANAIIMIFMIRLNNNNSVAAKKAFIRNDTVLLLSGLVTAFALINILNGNNGIKMGFILAAALLLVIFVVPDTENIPGMFISYLITAVPAVLLEVNVTSFSLSPKTAVICLMVVLVPVIISVLFHQKTQDNVTQKKAAISALAVLINITAVILRFLFPEEKAFDTIFQELVNVVLVTVIPLYVKSVFDALLQEEYKLNRKDKKGNLRIPKDTDEAERDRLQRKRNILYLISAVVFIGVIVMMFSVIIPEIPFYTNNEISLNILLWCGIGVVAASLVVISVNAAYSEKKCSYQEIINKKKEDNKGCIIEIINEKKHKRWFGGEIPDEADTGNPDYTIITGRYEKYNNSFIPALRKTLSLFFMGIAYAALCVIIIFSLLGGKIFPENFIPLHLFVIPPIVFTSVFLAFGYYRNMVCVRGYEKEGHEDKGEYGKGFVIASSIIIFIGTLTVSSFSVFQMIQSDSIISIVLHMAIMLLSNIILPVMIAATQDKRPLRQPQLVEKAIYWDAGRLFGVTQDGFLFSLTALAVEFITIFFVAKEFSRHLTGDELVDSVVGMFLLLQFSSWALEYCVDNNVIHFHRVRDNSDVVYKKGADNFKSISEEAKRETKQYEYLYKHVSLQNIMSIAIAMPYSIYTIFSMLFVRLMDSEKRPLLKPNIDTKNNSEEIVKEKGLKQ